MIRFLLILSSVMVCLASSEELKVISDNFKGDQRQGVSVFNGNVKVTKGKDELNATKVTIYTDKENKPTKYLAEGDVSFYIVTEMNEKYKGKSQTAIFLPNENEYQFFTKVDLIRMDDYRRVKGDKVVVNTIHGHASAESANNEPVIMTFTIQDKKSKSTPK
ncbi:lipopolysaccharide transport periplasmic protein LptA [Sulfuricurvum sp.]|uniref:lipopolysaccharide transport periplasmic protein LptA n=1 Tax=Sulfuricurvum sp. TaxID=2025608 RepID=UPI002620A070|nr:lipopolysaccharide transport periplasmic protein LptA [Sulfuricurvum sp.]MDD2780521.1 lipopolysaccharide transport periplasmic protein LptA [Sulfuricurvum sp.]